MRCQKPPDPDSLCPQPCLRAVVADLCDCILPQCHCEGTQLGDSTPKKADWQSRGCLLSQDSMSRPGGLYTLLATPLSLTKASLIFLIVWFLSWDSLVIPSV